jgi:DNA-binding response OmpR family regulator
MHSKPGRAKKLILVADDDAAMASAVSRFLVSRGYEVIQAGDGGRAVELARARRPAVVVLDINMPVKDGVEVLRELAPEMPGTGFIMLTGNDDEAVARACRKIGAMAYLYKPADMELLESLIKAWVMNPRPRKDRRPAEESLPPGFSTH